MAHAELEMAAYKAAHAAGDGHWRYGDRTQADYMIKLNARINDRDEARQASQEAKAHANKLGREARAAGCTRMAH